MEGDHKSQEVVLGRQPGTLIQNVDMEELLFENHSRNADWLSKKFNSLPFLLYKCWIILNSILALFAEYILILELRINFSMMREHEDLIICMSSIVSITFVIYGYFEMLFAINQRKSRVAQRSFLKFQYYFIGLLIFQTIEIRGLHSSSFAELSIYIYIALNPIINLIGGFAVLKAFKENHPLKRLADSEVAGVSNPLLADLLEQNKTLAAKILKYDEQLNSWPYVIFNWWLKLAVAFEVSFVFNLMPYQIWRSLKNEEFSPNIFLFIAVFILSFFNAYSRFEMEVAMRTRDSAKSKRAVLLLKISLLSSVISYIAVAKELDASEYGEFEIFIPSIQRFVFFAAIPVICLIGALKVHKLVDLRNRFAQVSNFTGGSYLF